jgi:hypothetical protein
MIYKKEKKGNITVYWVKKDFDDSKLSTVDNTLLKRNQIKDIIKDDADVYTEDGKLLIRYRKNKLSKQKIKEFYDNVIKFAQSKTTNRGSASGSKSKNVYDNPKIMTNIIGYFDKLSVRQKYKFKTMKLKTPSIAVRETRFVQDYPEKYKKLIPLIEEIDTYYKKLVPDNYAKQRKKANQTPFRIANTAFTTVTTNVNYQTAVHTDKGDDDEGFGNLTVIEDGRYTGGETCFPQYGIGIDIRTGDVAYMDVHQSHGNLKIDHVDKEAKRLSIVCYLRRGIWEKTKGKSKKFMERHNKTMRKIKESSNKSSRKNK